jgi:hypothetical protein
MPKGTLQIYVNNFFYGFLVASGGLTATYLFAHFFHTGWAG